MEITHRIKLDAPTPNGWILPRRCGEIIMGQAVGKYVYQNIDVENLRSLASDISKISGVIQSAEIEDDELVIKALVFEKSEPGIYLKYWAERNAAGDTSGGDFWLTINLIANLDQNNVVMEDQLIFVGLQVLGIK